MADIISFQEAVAKRGDSLEDGDITQLLRRAKFILEDEKTTQFQERLGIVGKEGIKKILERKIVEEIFKTRLISSDIFLCGIYVADLLNKFVKKSVSSWWAIDYISDNPLTLKRGGDTCFLICGVFPERGNIRLMDLSYYEKIGAGFYHRFYNFTNREIGHYMSQRFGTMAHLVQNCLKNF